MQPTTIPARALLWVGLALAGAALLLAPRSAAADGLPVVNLDTTGTGVAARDGSAHYYAVSGAGGTDVLAVRPDDGSGRDSSLRRLSLDGILAIPGVAFDGTTGGLSADGSRLALIEPRRSFPRRSTRMVVVDTETMKSVSTVDLDGDFSFDAISPDGATIYAIHYLSRVDPTKYEVRAYDVAGERLRPEPIIDSRTAPIVMRGFPITRATSPDGAWEYTLYDGAGKTPFVHALDTSAGEAICIDLEMLGGEGRRPAPDLFETTLVPSDDGASIAVLDPAGEDVATIATDDWSTAGPAVVAAGSAEDGGVALPWIGAPLIALGLVLIAWSMRRLGLRGGPVRSISARDQRRRTPGHQR